MTETSPPPIVTMIVAMTYDRVIGMKGAMPWTLPSDLGRFRRLTMGRPLVMGRRTFESIGRPLPGRQTIVLSRSGLMIEGVHTATSLPEAISMAGRLPETDGRDVMVVGGGEIYAMAMPMAERMLVTYVDADLAGDTLFPRIDSEEWTIHTTEDGIRDERDSHRTRYVEYRKSPILTP
jgi:dihydrofolate reductase